MAVYLNDGKVLLNSGSVATNTDCCCGTACKKCANIPPPGFDFFGNCYAGDRSLCPDCFDYPCPIGDPVDCRIFYSTSSLYCCNDDSLHSVSTVNHVTCMVTEDIIHNCDPGVETYVIASDPYDRCVCCCPAADPLPHEAVPNSGVIACQDAGGFAISDPSYTMCPDPCTCGRTPFLHEGTYYTSAHCDCATDPTFSNSTDSTLRCHTVTHTCTPCPEGWTGSVTCTEVSTCCGSGEICVGEIFDEHGVLQYNTCPELCPVALHANHVMTDCCEPSFGACCDYLNNICNFAPESECTCDECIFLGIGVLCDDCGF